jgi:hypothetical protein
MPVEMPDDIPTKQAQETAFLSIWQCASGVHGGKKP